MTDEERARRLALRYLAYQPRTVAEVRRRLARAGFDEALIETVIEELTAGGLLDDEAFSRAWVEDRASRRGLGSLRLSRELARKGVAAESIADAVSGAAEPEALRAAVELGLRRLGLTPPLDIAARRRLAGFLLRRGFAAESLEQVFADLMENTE
jgi:regulatory protein